MIRVLHIVKAMTRDGLETFIMNVYRQLNREEVQFDFLVFTDEEAAYDKEILALGGRIYHLPSRGIHYYRYLNALISFFKKNKYAVVHMHTNSLGNLEPLIIARLLGVHTRILHSHSSTIKGRKITQYLHYINKRFSVYKCANVLCACSQKAAVWFYGSDYEKKGVQLITNGIDTDLFNFNARVRADVRNKLCISEDTIVIGHVGRLTEIKNQSFIIEITEELKRRGEKVKTILLGEGEDRQKLEELVLKKKLNDTVYMVGSVSNTYDYYNAMDVFVMPSYFEGLPVTLVEAQCCGLSCVISDVISHDVDLTGNLTFVSLNDSIDSWCDKILVAREKIRNGQKDKMIKAGYDSNITLRSLLAIYLGEDE